MGWGYNLSINGTQDLNRKHRLNRRYARRIQTTSYWQIMRIGIALLALVSACFLWNCAATAQLPLQDCRQSSTHAPCRRAIDHNTNQKWSGNSCSHTNMQNKPWWQANTGRLAHFRKVRIYNRLCGSGCSSHQNNLVIKVDGVSCASYHSSNYFSVKTFHCNRVGQVLEIQSTVRSYLMLCEVQVFGNWASLAHRGSRIPLRDCRQSSTHTPCQRAIDNNLNQHWPGKSCAHTNREKNPWWQANTNRLAHIKQVRIYTRLCSPGCRKNFRNIVVKVDGHICARHKGVGLGSTITLNCDRVGQVVEIQALAKKTHLMLCEVQVFGTYASLAHKGALLPLRHCSQSSTHTPCGRAIDGKRAQHWPAKSCSHTKMQTKPWWQAKTIKPAFIQQVRIYARLCGPICSRYLKHLIVKVDGRTCARYNSDVGYLSTHTFNCNRYGSTVRIESTAKTYLMLCEVQIFGRYGRKPPPTHTETGTHEETGAPDRTGTTDESGSPWETGHGGGETSEVATFERHCIDGHDSSEHKLGTSWTTKVPAEGYCYHYSCTKKSEAGPVSVDCMDASGHCVKPSSKGTDFACRTGHTSCLCIQRDGRTGIMFS